jgi:hypothetical protein
MPTGKGFWSPIRYCLKSITGITAEADRFRRLHHRDLDIGISLIMPFSISLTATEIDLIRHRWHDGSKKWDLLLCYPSELDTTIWIDDTDKLILKALAA